MKNNNNNKNIIIENNTMKNNNNNKNTNINNDNYIKEIQRLNTQIVIKDVDINKLKFINEQLSIVNNQNSSAIQALENWNKDRKIHLENLNNCNKKYDLQNEHLNLTKNALGACNNDFKKLITKTIIPELDKQIWDQKEKIESLKLNWIKQNEKIEKQNKLIKTLKLNWTKQNEIIEIHKSDINNNIKQIKWYEQENNNCESELKTFKIN